MRRLLVNDCLTTIPGTRTFWHDLQEWFSMEFVGGDFSVIHADGLPECKCLPCTASRVGTDASVIIRNATYFGPIEASNEVPTISLLQDIIEEGPQRRLQDEVLDLSKAVVFNSKFTESKYTDVESETHVIPLPVDFSLFEPGNPMGLQQALQLPDGCVCWVGAWEGAAGHVKGWDIFLSIVRLNPDIPFVAVMKDSEPPTVPPNLRVYVRQSHEELVQIIGACRVGLCTSRTESQHLSGIEMGACGLPLVVPPVGTYWEREGLPGIRTGGDVSVGQFTAAIRETRGPAACPDETRSYWQREFDKPVIRKQWEALIAEVECSGAS